MESNNTQQQSSQNKKEQVLEKDKDNNDFQMLGINRQTSNDESKNAFIQKRNRMNSTEIENINQLEIDLDAIKMDDLYDNISDIGPKSATHQKKPLLNESQQISCKKMSIDLDDDQSMSNVKKGMSCNCKNSGCLKRYCECFSRMKYCDENCQCKNCFNVVQHEQERSNAIRYYLIKSPVSFKKINMDLNNVICNCKKSNCLKNYCECFQLGMKCTFNCGCVDCKNRNLFEKKLFYVENKSNTIENNKNVNSNTGSLASNNITNSQTENTNTTNSVNNDLKLLNDKAMNSSINDSKNNNIQNKQNNAVNFIVDKNTTPNNNGTIFQNKFKSRKRFLSFDEDMYQWNNLNLKKIEISNNKLIIDNYNINNHNNGEINCLGYQNIQPNFQPNFNITPNLNNHNIITRKNSAFSAIIQ